MSNSYLAPEQVRELNEKFGWFEFGDAQSDVSKAFAQAAIEKHELMRAAAPDLTAALLAILAEAAPNIEPPYSGHSYLPPHLIEQARAALEKAGAV